MKSSRDKEILRWLDGWRELALLTRSILLWELPSYPFALLGAVTLLFLEISVLEPVTVACGLGLLAVLFDYAVPRLCQRFWQGEEWTSAKQAQLEEMSQSMASAVDGVFGFWHKLQASKVNSPTTYYMMVVPTLFIFGWIGSIVNNLFISYLIVLFIVMLPGLHYRGLTVKYYSMALDTIVQVLRGITHRSSPPQLDKKAN